ncbi:IctB family putative bicarbonate transporter [Chlorogloea sp. CCALA 695]|uniref:IctB family putative bicarbonate transporter n=1 Tax=Chlorogloea sp. CCALA 695 TaxID=2107693 RepID=UPI000D054A28|nr:IctB family putative bicarbonate transporter [Chlorogloea sp. CCALA 695]PSB35053.1 putative bicarbonate transporter, IctB family [Chlorogloea sp. CCALA 695]
MNLIWQQFTLRNLPLQQWQNASYLHRPVGLLRNWRQSSWLMQWSEPLAALLVSLVFGLAPFVSNDLVKVLLLACGSFWILLTVADDAKTKVTPIHWLVLLYWAIATVATALSPVKADAFAGLMKLTSYLLLFALSARVLRFPRLRSFVIGVYLHVALIVSVYGVQQWFDKVEPLATWNDPNSAQATATRVYSYLGNPNLLAGYLLPALILSFVAIFAWQRWTAKALALTMFLVNAACLAFTGSRGGWIATVVAMVAVVFLLRQWWAQYLPSFWRKWAIAIFIGSLAILLLAAIVLSESLRDRLLTIFAGRGDSSNNFRQNVWAAVIEMIRDRPFLGIGPGNNAFNKIYPLYQRPRFTALSAYSVLLEIAVETGFVGLACFLWLLVVTLNQGWVQLMKLRETRSREGFWLIGATAVIVGMLAHGAVDTVWYRPEINTVWWLMVALIASYYSNPPGQLPLKS